MESDVSQSAFFYRAYAWVDAHRKQLLLLLGALAAVAIGITAFIWNENRKESVANAALSTLTATTATGDAPPAPEALARLADEHPGTDAAGRALLLAGAGYFADGRHAEAKAQFDKYLREYRGSTFVAQALMGSAAATEGLGDLDGAARAYADIATRFQSDFAGIQAKLALGRIYEVQNKLTEARDAYEEVMRSGLTGSVVSQAGVAYQALLAKHPELAQPREPSPSPAGAPASAPLVRPAGTNGPVSIPSIPSAAP